MKKLLAKLNKEGIFHMVTSDGVKILKQPADMDAKGKDLLKKFFGFDDFTVPKTLKEPFENKANPKTSDQASQESKKAHKMDTKVKEGL
jgi:hypothetical protein